MVSLSDLIMAVAARVRNVPAALTALAGAVVSRWRIAAIAGGGAVAVAGAGVLLIWLSGPPAPPPPEKQTPKQVRDYLASAEFGDHSVEVRQAYLDKVIASGTARARRDLFGRGNLTDEQRRQLRQNVQPVVQNMMQQRIDQYFELPPDQRTAYLDKMIDQMMAWRPSGPPRRPPPQTTQPAQTARPQPTGSSEQQPRSHRPGRGFTPQRMKRHIESTPPEMRAKLIEFMKAFRKRMEERGITFGGPGRRSPH